MAFESLTDKFQNIFSTLKKKGKLKVPKLKEIIGHNITEVVAGAILGVIIAIIIFLF